MRSSEQRNLHGVLRPHSDPIVHFGNGTGPWDRETLYVMDMEQGLWSLPVGVRGHPDAFRP